MHDFLKGARQEFPIALTAIPFGLILGASLESWGIPVWLGLSTSIIIFAGSSQFITLQMISVGAPMLAVVFTALATNLRHVFYTLKLVPFFKKLPLPQKIVATYLLTDECFAAVHEIEKKEPLNFKIYFGAGFTLWAIWNISTLLGALLGNVLPQNLHLDKTIDFLFLAILTLQIQNRGTFFCALFAATVSILTSFLPFKINIIIGLMMGFLGQRLLLQRKS